MSEPTKRSPSALDRRAARRARPRGSVRVECRKGSLGLGRNIARQFLDVSETGIRLLLTAELARGEEAEIRLEGMTVAKTIKRMARVIWSFKTGEDSYCAGLRFDKALSYLDVQRLSAAPALSR
jgi:hypothetical protein